MKVAAAMKNILNVMMVGGVLSAMCYMLVLKSFWIRSTAALMFPGFIGWYSLKRGSLSPSGAVAAWFVGFGTFLAGLRAVVILLTFFISSSALTKLKEDFKERSLAEHKKGGQRDWVQVQIPFVE